ncbi:MAG: hypothetical protein HGJ93_00630 [Desulfosarcina sp.]|nr:hypothetical protein [Desulfosarcina sp.]MBC2764491.1 hypothetical protein [Desulfosarcina sp.]
MYDEPLKTREYNGQPVRSTIYRGQVWWSIKDVARALDIDETATALFWQLQEDEKNNPSFLTEKGRQYLRCCNRKGMLYLIGKSENGEAFQQWVETRFKRELAAKMEKIDGLRQAGRDEEKQPDSGACDVQLEPDDTGMVTPTQIGKALGITAQQVNYLMVAVGMQKTVMDLNRKRYLLTAVGKHFGVVRRVNKANGEETGQVLWDQSVVGIVAAKNRSVERNAKGVGI